MAQQKIEHANTFWKQHFGLMFRKSDNYTMIFNLKKPSEIFIHTFFMRFPIDIICLNERGGIIKEIKGLRPWKILRIKEVSTVIERTSNEY